MVAYGDRPLPSALVGLEMGPLIGSGSFAKGGWPAMACGGVGWSVG